MRLEGALPSSRFPSDHLPLLAYFDFTSPGGAPGGASPPMPGAPLNINPNAPPTGEEEQTSPKRSREQGGKGGGRGQRSRPRPRQRQ